MFMNMVLKSMREATPSSGLLDGQNEKIYTSMLDQQLAQNLSGRGLGLAEAMLAQLQRSAAAGTDERDADPGRHVAGAARRPSAVAAGGHPDRLGASPAAST